MSGSVSGIKFKNADPSTGVFSRDGTVFNTGISTTNPDQTQLYAWSRPDFEASRASAIYGSSDTVQPKAVRAQFLIRYE